MYEFDFKTYIKLIWRKRQRIIINCVIGGIIAIIIAFSIPKEYSASVSLASETQTETSLGNGAGALASLAGINVNMGEDALTPILYPDVVHSNKFLTNLLYVRIQTLEGDITTDYKTYIEEYYRLPWWGFIQKGINKCIRLLIPKDEKKTNNLQSPDGRINPFWMSADDWNLLNFIRSKINCLVDNDTQVITLSVKSQDPLVAAIMVDSVRSHLQRFITLYHTNKAATDLVYYKKLENKAQKAYRKAQDDYASFCDSHMGSTLQTYIKEQERLENELQLAFNSYSQIKQQVQLAEAKVQEQTPAFTEIEGTYVPVTADSPKKVLILFAGLFLTFIGTATWYYIKLLFFNHD